MKGVPNLASLFLRFSAGCSQGYLRGLHPLPNDNLKSIVFNDGDNLIISVEDFKNN